MNRFSADMDNEKDIKFYQDSIPPVPMDRDSTRDILLAELKNFRGYMASDWGGFGSGNSVGGTGLYGFFSKQSFGSYYQSPHAIQSTVVNPTGTNAGTSGTKADGNDFGRIFVNKYNDRVSPLPTGALTGAQKTPSFIIDLPQWAQKLSIESIGPGLVYNSRTSPFTEGAILTGATSGAKATITASFPDGTNGTLYLANIVGTFTDTEIITDSSGGSATNTRLTYTRTNSIQRFYGVGGQEVRTDATTTIFTFWGAIDNFCPQRFFSMPASVAGTARDVELITGFQQEGFTYVRLGTPNALRIYLNGAWHTII
jgi:hypothetical protein